MARSLRARWIAAAAAAFAISGCTAGVQMATVDARTASSGRPHPSYYCYDCHGYRYFDPYYDWCAGYGEGARAKDREKNSLVPGSDGRPMKGRERKEPRDGKPRDSLREGA